LLSFQGENLLPVTLFGAERDRSQVMSLKPKGFQALGLKLQFRPAIEIGKCLKCDEHCPLFDGRKEAVSKSAGQSAK